MTTADAEKIAEDAETADTLLQKHFPDLERVLHKGILTDLERVLTLIHNIERKALK